MKQTLKTVIDLESLISYFSLNLNWNIDSNDFDDIDDITYDFEAKDIGLKEEAFAKIISLRQLRPLIDHQKWGIFIVEFNSSHFEVSALKKILSGLVPKRRNAADHAVWNQHDLLFLCFWGEDNNRTIGIAHFEEKESALPQIKIISCAPALEDFTQIKIFEQKLALLAWPEDPSNFEKWRTDWSSAITTKYHQVIQDSSTLTVQLATEAQNIRNRILEIFDVESSTGYVHLLYEKMKNTLIHDMSEQQFADMYAQTVVYGLFSARCLDTTQEVFCVKKAISCIPITNPFLRRLLQECIGVERDKSKLSFDELEIGNVVELLLNAKTKDIIEDFNRQTGGGREDPVIHFYEEFLSAYDKAQRIQKGVYYTPQPVVNFIVQAVDDILKYSFNQNDGLASIETKKISVMRDSKKKTDGLIYKQIKEKIDVPAIQILDPATGTGTFLRQIILQIYSNFCHLMTGKTADEKNQAWNEYVPKYLLPRINGFELMMAPYAVAHMKLAMVLKDTGYNFECNERLNVFLTNSLEKAGHSSNQLTMWADPLATESVEANVAKNNTGINIIIGNPPYNNSSTIRNEWILDLISLYKEGLNERKLNLDEDSIKFTRLGQFLSERSDNSILAYVSNNSFINGVTHRKMRYELMKTYDTIYILNLHGDSNRREKCPDGSKDENVFDIKQGVSINIFIRSKNQQSNTASVYYSDLYGTREYKYFKLGSVGFSEINWELIKPERPYYFFDNKNYSDSAAYESGFSVADLFIEKNTGIQTKNDSLTIQFTEQAIETIVDDFLKLPEETLSEKYNIKSGGTWTTRAAKADLLRKEFRIVPISFRPFDIRYTALTNKSSGFIGRPRYSTMIHMNSGFQNFALLVGRQNKSDTIDSFLVTDLVSEMKCAERTIQSYHMPILLFSKLFALNFIIISQNKRRYRIKYSAA